MVFTLGQAKKQLRGLDPSLQMFIYHNQNNRKQEADTYMEEYLETIRLMKEKMELSSNSIDEAQCFKQESRDDSSIKQTSDDNK